MSDRELAAAYPEIERILEYLVAHQRSSWIHQGEWWVKGLSRPVYRGIGIRIDRRDTALYRQALLEDIRLRERWIERLVCVVRWRLRRFKFSSGYTRRQLERFRGSSEVADALSYQVDQPLHVVAALRRALGAYSPGGGAWTMCAHILDTLEVRVVDDETVETMHRFLFDRSVPRLPYLSRLRLRLEVERIGKTRHGQGCLTLEAFPIEGMPRTSHEDDSDIPF